MKLLGVLTGLVMATALSACVALGGGNRAVSPSPSASSQTATGPRTPAPLLGSAGTFQIRDANGYTFDLIYSYEPARIKSRPLVMANSHMAEVQIEAQYSLQIINTTQDHALSFKPSSIWEATFGLYAFWESPNLICDGILGPGRKGDWCAVKLAHFHIDQEVPPGGSVQLTAHPGFSDSYPIDAGTVAVDPSDALDIRDALARPDDYGIDYHGSDGGRFIDSCPLQGREGFYAPEDRTRVIGWPLQIAARGGTCRAFMEKSIFPTNAQYVNPNDKYTYLD